MTIFAPAAAEAYTPGVRRAAPLLCCLALAASQGCGGPAGPSSRCGPYPDQASSAYVLPYPVGTAYTLVQGNCTGRSHRQGTRDEYAYDFRMPIGTPISASRDGAVVGLEERFQDGNRNAEEANYLVVDHGDGTQALYWHLTQNGSLVAVGQRVARGQAIGLSGDTGNSTEPHLHFGVVADGAGVPVSFRNSVPQPNGLAEGHVYAALPY
jgi:murein DD-endopeptidase MepM/ murein hydrolase activator NlpD